MNSRLIISCLVALLASACASRHDDGLDGFGLAAGLACVVNENCR